MQIFSWNVNGIRAVDKKGLFNDFIQKYQPDILCLQEIKANKDQFNFSIDNYFSYVFPAQKAGYSGTAILSKIRPLKIIQGFPDRIINKYNLEDDPYGNPNQEGRVLSLEFENFYLVNVYTPNAKDDLSRLELRHQKWDPAFLEFILELNKTKSVIFCGDLNVAHMEDDLANPKTNQGKKGFTLEEREGIDNIIKNNFIDTLRVFKHGNGFYTWWPYFANSRARNVGWRIDYFFISKDLKNKLIDANIYPNILGSDHCPININIKL